MRVVVVVVVVTMELRLTGGVGGASLRWMRRTLTFIRSRECRMAWVERHNMSASPSVSFNHSIETRSHLNRALQTSHLELKNPPRSVVSEHSVAVVVVVGVAAVGFYDKIFAQGNTPQSSFQIINVAEQGIKRGFNKIPNGI